jgi:hypothetical protein
VRSIDNNLEHINEQLFHRIHKTGTGSSYFQARSVYKFVWIIRLENRGLIDLNRTGWIPGSDACFFFHIENLAAAHPIERFL